ncbi:MAG: methyltransferase domain-containing protein [Gallionellaceae bacterium]|nr:methyltransferase domain-containing protein [Gallionellaceae bacterium]
MTACPCCGHAEATAHNRPESHFACPCCGHRWRVAGTGGEACDYSGMSGRNRVPARQLQRKFADRIASVQALLKDRCRILEVGCAEGEFGAMVKGLADVEYVGLEISLDAGIAATRLDRVLNQPAAKLSEGGFDLLLSFHVLEHIPDIGAEIGHWAGLLDSAGTLLVEVPNSAGHPLRDWDSHPEHLHFFSAASLSALFEHAGLAIESLSSGHYESPVYADSLRVTARRALAGQEKNARLLDRFRLCLDGPFVVYGLGGDFRNCVLPVLDQLPVAALVDSDPGRVGERVTEKHLVQAYDPARFAGLPILIASMRFKDEISQGLQATAAAPVKLVGLDAIYEMD